MGARVFVSCGQRKEFDEQKLAEAVEIELKNMGFSPVVIANRQSTDSLKEVIFRELQSSDYFLFIDFKRGNDADLPISLFSHQELAIAAYLDVPTIGFREEGLSYPIGMTGLWPANYRTFRRDDLIEVVKDEVERHWETEHKNKIVFDVPVHHNIPLSGDKPRQEREGVYITKYFQLPVRNGSFYKHGRNCTAYLSRSYKVDGKSEVEAVPGDIKWTGMLLPNVHLNKQIVKQPPFVRILNALFIRNNEPHIGYLNLIGDNRDYSIAHFKGPGEFFVEYTIVSDNFDDSKACFHLTLGRKVDDARLVRVEDNIFETGFDR